MVYNNIRWRLIPRVLRFPGEIMGNEFPAGPSALHPDWPAGRFNVSGLFCYEPLVLGYLRFVEQGFGCQAPIEAVYGAPAVAWNGGRIVYMPLKPDEHERYISELNARNIACLLTFTNHLVETADLADSMCNFLLDRIGRRCDLNGVIIASDLLSRYIAGKYPSLRQIASITKVTMEKGKGNAEYYRQLGRRFPRYVVHPDDCFDLKLLDQLDRDQAEIIVNENCLRECGTRPAHYQWIAESHKALGRQQAAAGPNLAAAIAQQASIVSAPQPPQSPPECPSVPMVRQIGRHRRNCNMTPGELKAIYDMGFRHFKLQGRRDSLFGFAYDLVRYTLEPDFAAPLVYKTLCGTVKFK